MYNTLARYRRLIAHMICESLGYFTPSAAARAIEAYKERRPYYCEWYMHMFDCYRQGGDKTSEEELMLKIGKMIIRDAFERRRYHKGFMAEYKHAKALVEKELEGKHVMFASWF